MTEGPATTLSTAAKLVELGRPVVLTALFVAVGARWGWAYAAPVALASVFAWSILVHDLIHNALRLGPRGGAWALAVAAQFLLKSGHGLRALHAVHHRDCLADHDSEGRVVFAPWGRLMVTGPWLAWRARGEAWRASPSTRGWQALETAGNVALLGALLGSAWWARHPGPLVYWAAVVLVTVTAPLWGAKIPHMVPYGHPWVRRMAGWTGRLTPGLASVLLHELHHRRPGLPVSLLPAHRGVLDASAPSQCAARMAQGTARHEG
jgi:hypothetical protein